MNKQILSDALLSGKSIQAIAKESNKSYSTIQYWIKKYKLQSSHTPFKIIKYENTRRCPKCETNLSLESFYQRRGKAHSSVYCKSCTSQQTIERVRFMKSQMVEYKGGKCQKCGYNKYQGALEFHHLDPTQKDFTLSHVKKYSFNETIKKELDKCILLCSNCHKETHFVL